MNCFECLKKNDKVVVYVCGLLTAYAGKKLLNSAKVRTACVSTLAKGMLLQKEQKAMYKILKMRLRTCVMMQL